MKNKRKIGDNLQELLRQLIELSSKRKSLPARCNCGERRRDWRYPTIVHAEERSKRVDQTPHITVASLRITVEGEDWLVECICGSHEEQQELKKIRDWKTVGRQPTRQEIALLSHALKSSWAQCTWFLGSWGGVLKWRSAAEQSRISIEDAEESRSKVPEVRHKLRDGSTWEW